MTFLVTHSFTEDSALVALDDCVILHQRSTGERPRGSGVDDLDDRDDRDGLWDTMSTPD
jgi:hypothetical protein